MNIKVDEDSLVNVEYHIEEDGIYTITFEFDNGQCCTYGYSNVNDFIKDCTKLVAKEYKC